jgi:hypothetical protein
MGVVKIGGDYHEIGLAVVLGLVVSLSSLELRLRLLSSLRGSQHGARIIYLLVYCIRILANILKETLSLLSFFFPSYNIIVRSLFLEPSQYDLVFHRYFKKLSLPGFFVETSLSNACSLRILHQRVHHG